MAVHEAAAVAVGAVLRALIADGFYAERDLAHALRLAAVAVTELPNSMVWTHSHCPLFHQSARNAAVCPLSRLMLHNTQQEAPTLSSA